MMKTRRRRRVELDLGLESMTGYHPRARPARSSLKIRCLGEGFYGCMTSSHCGCNPQNGITAFTARKHTTK